MLAYLGWIAAAFLGGFLLAHLQRKNHPSLRENFARVDIFQGRGYREILTIAGAKPNSIIRQADGRVVKVWREARYYLALEFDEKDVCLGVVDERF